MDFFYLDSATKEVGPYEYVAACHVARSLGKVTPAAYVNPYPEGSARFCGVKRLTRLGHWDLWGGPGWYFKVEGEALLHKYRPEWHTIVLMLEPSERERSY